MPTVTELLRWRACFCKTNAAFSVTAFYYSSYDEGSFTNKETIISANVADEFAFDNDKYVRFVFSAGSVINPQTVIQNTSMKLYSFDEKSNGKDPDMPADNIPIFPFNISIKS